MTKREDVTVIASRRDLLRGIAMGAAVVTGRGDAEASAQSAADTPGAAAQSDAEAFLAQFERAWRPLDPQLRFVLRLIYARLRGLPPPAQLSPAELRRINDSLSFYWGAGAPAVPHIEERTIAMPSGPHRLRLYDPGTASPAPAAVLLHGGGWVFGSLDTYDGVARQIAQRSGLRCVSVEYALAPEHPFPAPLDDCIAALRWVLTDGAQLGIDPRRVTVIGDSAGANLALAACLVLRKNGAHPLRGAALMYGAYSLDLDTASVRAYGDGAYFLGRADMDRYWRDYLPDQTARENRLAVPMLADPTGLPPLYIAACEFDPLLDDSRRLAERAKTANVDVEFRVWNGMVHGALSLMGWIDAMGSHVDHIGGFLRRVTQA
jgi:acetyl esterase